MRKFVYLLLFIHSVAYSQKSGSSKESGKVSEANVIQIISELPDAEIYHRARQVLHSNGLPMDSTVIDLDAINTLLFRLNTNYDMKIRIGIKEGKVRVTGIAYNQLGTAYRASTASESRGATEAFKRMNYYALVLRDKMGSRHIEYIKE